MSELDSIPEEIVAECLGALDAGASQADCLDRYPQFAAQLRAYFDLRGRLATLQAPAPSPAGYAAGREALLSRVQSAAVARAPERGPRPFFAAGWFHLPLVRFAAAAVAVFLLAGGALGASAAAGVGQARNALSALHIVPSTSNDRPPQSQDDGRQSTPVTSGSRGGERGDEGASATDEHEGPSPNSGQGSDGEGEQCSTSDSHGGDGEGETDQCPPATAEPAQPAATPEEHDADGQGEGEGESPTETSDGSGEGHDGSTPAESDSAHESTPSPHADAPSEDQPDSHGDE